MLVSLVYKEKRESRPGALLSGRDCTMGGGGDSSSSDGGALGGRKGPDEGVTTKSSPEPALVLLRSCWEPERTSCCPRLRLYGSVRLTDERGLRVMESSLRKLNCVDSENDSPDTS